MQLINISLNTFILNNQLFDYKSIKYKILDTPKNNYLTLFEQNTLQFIHQWLNGSNFFPIRTSGSTGPSKELLLSREQMQQSARLTGNFFSFQKGLKSLVCLNTSYVAGMMMLVRSMEYDMLMTVVEPSSDPLQNFPQDTSFDFAAFVPLQLETLLQNPKSVEILDRMRVILVGGAPLSPALTASLSHIKAPIFHTYGMTETASHIALRRINGEKPDDFYTTLPETKIGLDERGCLTIVSPVTKGLKIITNDLVDVIGKRTFRWLGRIDRVINSGGVKINLEEAEQKITEALKQKNKPLVFFLYQVDDARLGQAPAIVIETELTKNTDIVFLQGLFTESLHPYEIPRSFYFIKNFLRTPTGKINYAESFKASVRFSFKEK